MPDNKGDLEERLSKISDKFEDIEKELKKLPEENNRLINEVRKASKNRDLELGIALIALGLAFSGLLMAEEDPELGSILVGTLATLGPLSIGTFLLLRWIKNQ